MTSRTSLPRFLDRRSRAIGHPGGFGDGPTASRSFPSRSRTPPPSEALPEVHRDLFDRLLAHQARLERVVGPAASPRLDVWPSSTGRRGSGLRVLPAELPQARKTSEILRSASRLLGGDEVVERRDEHAEAADERSRAGPTGAAPRVAEDPLGESNGIDGTKADAIDLRCSTRSPRSRASRTASGQTLPSTSGPPLPRPRGSARRRAPGAGPGTASTSRTAWTRSMPRSKPRSTTRWGCRLSERAFLGREAFRERRRVDEVLRASREYLQHERCPARATGSTRPGRGSTSSAAATTSCSTPEDAKRRSTPAVGSSGADRRAVARRCTASCSTSAGTAAAER